MGAYDKFRTDTDLEKKGVVLDYGDFRVTIARAGGSNKSFQKTLERKTRPYQRAIQTDTMDNAKAEELLKEAYAEAVVKNWEVLEDGEFVQGVEDPDTGERLPVNAENIAKVFKHKELVDIWYDIRANAQKSSLFRSSVEEARAGN